MRALVVGRFQPLHNGHVALIQRALEHAGSVMVAIGSSDASGTARNPFTFDERREMLEAVFGDRIHIKPVPDIHNPPAWVAHLAEITGPFDEVFGNDNATMDLFEDAGHTVHRPGLQNRDSWQSSTIRAWLVEDDPSWTKAVPRPVKEWLVRMEASKRLRTISA